MTKKTDQQDLTAEEKLAVAMDFLRKLEWSSEEGCEGTGFMGSGPPMHRHPGCPVCHGLNPDDPYGHVCFMEEAYGHRRSCKLGKFFAGKLETKW